MKSSDTINELAAAMHKVQVHIGRASKDKDNPHFKSKYATLSSVVDAIQAAIVDTGLSWTQGFSHSGPQVFLVTKIMHISGQWIESEIPLTPVKHDPQGVVSATTYMRRNALSAAFGVAPDDDDGNAASGKPETTGDAEKGKGGASAPVGKAQQRLSSPSASASTPTTTNTASTTTTPVTTTETEPRIDLSQQKRLLQVAKDARWPDHEVKKAMAKIGANLRSEILLKHYLPLINHISQNPYKGGFHTDGRE